MELGVRENVMCNLSKNVKSHVFLGFQKNVKNIKTTPLSHAAFNYSITGKSGSPTSNILLRSADTRNYPTENCV